MIQRGMILLTLLVLLSSPLPAVGEAVSWAKTYGGSNRDWADSVQQTRDGGYIVAGYAESFGAGMYDFLLLKLDSAGNVVWQKAYGGSNWDWADSVQQTKDGGYIVAGYADSFGAGGRDFFLLKLDSEGDVSACDFTITDTAATVEISNAKSSVSSTKITTGQASVTITNATVTSAAATAKGLCGPTIRQLTPEAVGVGGALTTLGKGFGTDEGKVLLGNLSLPIVSWNATRIEATVPQEANTGFLSVQTGSFAMSKNSRELIVLPVSPAQLRPTSGPKAGGTRVAILKPDEIPSTQFNVLFGSVPATNIKFISPNIIVCTAPPGNGVVDVSVSASGVVKTVGTFAYR